MKEYELDVDPRILELLGPNLYTNIYYVLAELIANAYDADAHNVYIISNDNDIRIEDDGHGMSYEKAKSESSCMSPVFREPMKMKQKRVPAIVVKWVGKESGNWRHYPFPNRSMS